MKGAKRKNTRIRLGFTLAELIVVMAVTGILLTVVTISVSRIDEDSRLSVAAARALADLRYAQERAMAEQKEVSFSVNQGANQYWATYQESGQPLLSSLKTPLKVQLNQGDSKGVVITSTQVGVGQLSFNSDGLPLLNGSALTTQVTVMFLNNKMNIVLFPSGYSVINPVPGGCGSSCGC